MKDIDLDRVASVYSGKPGKCCCGCSGKHTYASKHREWSSETRGYLVADFEVNDKTVAKIVAKLNANKPWDINCQHMVIKTIDDRLYVAYLIED